MIVKKLKCDICGAEIDFINSDKPGYERIDYPHGWALVHVALPGLITNVAEECIPARYKDFEVCPKHGLVEIDIEELTVSED